jgi:hypothetical protein
MEDIFDNDLTHSIIAEEPSIMLPSLPVALAIAQSVALVTDNVPRSTSTLAQLVEVYAGNVPQSTYALA